MSLLSALPARYAKAIASAVAALIAYTEAYGATWHLVPALIFIGGILGVGGVPNTPSPAPPVPPAPVPPPPPVINYGLVGAPPPPIGQP